MKSLTIACMALLCCLASNSNAQGKKPAYTAAYTSSFTIGNATHANMVLDLWKDWDENQFDRHDYFADTIKLWLADSMLVKGKATAKEGAKKYRGSMASCKSVIHAWVPLHSTDKGDDMVCIWGTETDTFPDGRVEVKDLHEVWWFNKDGKVTAMRQWAAKFVQ